jgi:hypothetical protein
MTRTFFVSAAGVNLDACGLRVTVLCRIQAANVQYCNERPCADALLAQSCERKAQAAELKSRECATAATPAGVGVKAVS